MTITAKLRDNEALKQIRQYNEELNDELSQYKNMASTQANKIEELKKELYKKSTLLKMANGREKQANRDIGSMRIIYGDLFEDMMNRQVGMASAGWDKYYERKQETRREHD